MLKFKEQSQLFLLPASFILNFFLHKTPLLTSKRVSLKELLCKFVTHLSFFFSHAWEWALNEGIIPSINSRPIQVPPVWAFVSFQKMSQVVRNCNENKYVSVLSLLGLGFGV